MNLNKISDTDLKEEYNQRFMIENGKEINDSDGVIDHLKTFITEHDREHFLIMYLNAKNQLMKTENLFTGTLTTSAIYPREVIKRALAIGAAALIFAHNHPSGNPSPSNDDLRITDKLKAACKTIDIAVHDHIIITGNEYTSFANKGLI